MKIILSIIGRESLLRRPISRTRAIGHHRLHPKLLGIKHPTGIRDREASGSHLHINGTGDQCYGYILPCPCSMDPESFLPPKTLITRQANGYKGMLHTGLVLEWGRVARFLTPPLGGFGLSRKLDTKNINPFSEKRAFLKTVKSMELPQCVCTNVSAGNP